MKESNAHKIPITIADEYPPYSSTPPGQLPQQKGPGPKGMLEVGFPIDDPLASNFPHIGVVMRSLCEAPVQRIVISILAPHGERLWSTTLKTKGGFESFFKFEDKEKKIVGQHFQKGNTLQVSVADLENLELGISVVICKH